MVVAGNRPDRVDLLGSGGSRSGRELGAGKRYLLKTEEQEQQHHRALAESPQTGQDDHQSAGDHVGLVDRVSRRRPGQVFPPTSPSAPIPNGFFRQGYTIHPIQPHARRIREAHAKQYT